MDLYSFLTFIPYNGASNLLLFTKMDFAMIYQDYESIVRKTLYISNDLVEGDEAFVNLRKHCCSKRQQIFNYDVCKSLFKIGIYNNITKTIL